MGVIDQIKEHLDIRELISDYIELRKAGRNFVGFCPFHPNSRTPAFTVFPDTQSYHCFSCKKSGDVFTFVMEHEGLDFGEALERLAGRAKVQLQPRGESEEREDAQRAKLLEINALAATFYGHLLRASTRGAAARDYVAGRGLSEATVETFQLGYAPADWSALLAYLGERGIEPAEAEAAGLAIKRDDGGYYDRFRDRLLFPILDAKARVVGFGGRLFGDGHPKYLNSPQTAIFDKGALLYGFSHAREGIRREDMVVVVEGYVDVLMAHQAGFRNVVAPMGTALSASHVRTLSKLTKRIYLALDADAAGQSATFKGLQTLQEHLETRTVPVPTAEGLRWERELDAEIRVLALPAGRDPDEVIREDAQAWTRLIETAQPLMDFYLQALTADLDLQSGKGKATAVDRLLPLLGQIANRVEQAHYVQRLATLVGVEEQVIRGSLQRARSGPGPAQPRTLAVGASDSERENYLLALLLRYPNARQGLEEYLAGEVVAMQQLHAFFKGHIIELLESTENRQIWQVYEQALRAGEAQTGAWVATLPQELQAHVERIARQHENQTLPPYKVVADLITAAGPLRLRLARRWNRQLEQVIQAASPEEQSDLLASLNELQTYLHRLSVPPRSSYFRDTRDLAGL
jgi:DNA primase